MTTTRTLPMRVPADGLPGRVTIYEVGARDGLQNEQTIVPVGVKAEFLDRLADAGLTRAHRASSGGSRRRGCR